MARTFGDSISAQELQPYATWCKKHDIIMDENDPAAFENAQFVAEYFVNTWKEDMTDANLEAAFPVLQPHLKFFTPTPAQQVAKQVGIDQAQADALVSVLSRRALHENYLIENATAIAQYLLAQGWAFGPANIDQALTNIGNSAGAYSKLHWKSRLQDSEKAELARRQQNRDDLAQGRKDKVEDVQIPPGLPAYLHEHYRQLHQPKKTQATSAPVTKVSPYESLAESAVA